MLPSLLVLLLDCRPPKEARVTPDTLATVTSCLHLLQTLAGVQEWTAMTALVSNHLLYMISLLSFPLQALQPAKVVTSYRSLLSGLEPSLRSGLAVEVLTLASLLQGENKWKKVREELEGEEGTLALVAATLRREQESPELVRKALVILKATDYSIVGEQEQEVEEAERQEVVTMGPEQVLRIDQLLESVTEQLASSSLDSVLAGVVELAVARRGRAAGGGQPEGGAAGGPGAGAGADCRPGREGAAGGAAGGAGGGAGGQAGGRQGGAAGY